MSTPSFFYFIFRHPPCSIFFFFNDTATTEIYTLSLHDALPISHEGEVSGVEEEHGPLAQDVLFGHFDELAILEGRSEEHTSELQSHLNLVCRLLLEKKKKKKIIDCITHNYVAAALHKLY